MPLWITWWNLTLNLRPAFGRCRTFLWFTLRGQSVHCCKMEKLREEPIDKRLLLSRFVLFLEAFGVSSIYTKFTPVKRMKSLI